MSEPANAEEAEPVGPAPSPPPPPPTPPEETTIVVDGWGKFVNPMTGIPVVVRRYTMRNQSGLEVQVISYGAAVIRVRAPDKWGVLEDVLLAADNLQDYIRLQGYLLGGVVGRVAGKVWRARFRLDGVPVFLSKNYGNHHADGGYEAFHKVLWQSRAENGRVVMSLLNAPDREGYPGTLVAHVVYRLTTDGLLVVETQARSDKPTPIDLRHGLFLNLAGHGTGEKGVTEHILTLNSSNYFATSDDNSPSDNVVDAMGSRFDFLQPQLLKDRLHLIPRGGYDHTFCINIYPPDEISFAARLEHRPTGRVVEVYTNQPTLHLYTGRYLPENQFQKERVIPMPPPEEIGLRREPSTWPMTFKCIPALVKARSPSKTKQPETEMEKKKSSVWSIATCSVVLSSSDSDVWPISKPRNRWDKSTSTTSLAKAVEIATSTHLSIKDQATSMNPLQTEFSLHLLNGSDGKPPTPDPDEVEAQRREQLEQRWKEEDERWCDEEIASITLDDVSEVVRGKGMVPYYCYGGIWLATQGFPDAVNRDQFPSCILRPGETYSSITVYSFSTLRKTKKEREEEKERIREAEAKARALEEAEEMEEEETEENA